VVGQLIKERRLSKELTQIDLAERLGTTQRQITRWEQYTTGMPRQATRERLGFVLDIRPIEWHEAAALAEESGTVVAPKVAEDRAPYSTDAELLARFGAEPVADDDALTDEEFAASARIGRGNLIPQNYDEMRGRKTKIPRKPKPEPHIFKLRISGSCMQNTIQDGEVVYFDTWLPREPVAIVLAVKDDHEAHVKRLIGRDGRHWLESDDGWRAPVDDHWRILAVAFTAQRNLIVG